MFKKIGTAIALAAALFVSACANNGQPVAGGFGPKALGGCALGAVGGGFAGSAVGSGAGKLAAVGVGSLLGCALGGSVGQSLDQMDQQYAQNSFNQLGALPTNQRVNWNNPQSGNSGYLVAGPVDQRYGRNCREYQHTVYIGGQPQALQGTACRQMDGSWRPVG